MPNDDDRDLTPLARVMRSQKRPHTIVAFPGLAGVKIAIVTPSDEEMAEAQAAATQYLKGVLKLDEFQISLVIERNLYEAEEERQILARVLRDPADPDASFAKVNELREYLTPDVRKLLMKQLASWTEACNPEPKESSRDPAALVEFINDLKDAGALSEYLTSCDGDTLVSIAISLADRLPKRQGPSSTDISSSSSPNAGTSEQTATKSE